MDLLYEARLVCRTTNKQPVDMPELSLRVRLALRLSLVPVMVVLLAVSQPRAEVSEGTPQDTGMSAERLRRIDEVIQRAIDAKQISGAVTLVSRRGELAHFEAHGLMEIQADRAMQKNTIFPIASMTKPVAGVAILLQVDVGRRGIGGQHLYRLG